MASDLPKESPLANAMPVMRAPTAPNYCPIVLQMLTGAFGLLNETLLHVRGPEHSSSGPSLRGALMVWRWTVQV